MSYDATSSAGTATPIFARSPDENVIADGTQPLPDYLNAPFLEPNDVPDEDAADSLEYYEDAPSVEARTVHDGFHAKYAAHPGHVARSAGDGSDTIDADDLLTGHDIANDKPEESDNDIEEYHSLTARDVMAEAADYDEPQSNAIDLDVTYQDTEEHLE